MTTEFPNALRRELDQRAATFSRQTHLIVDYYRIRRRLAYPLPARRLHLPAYPVGEFTGSYVWSIWFTWALEERLIALGASATLSGDDHHPHAALARRDLQAMCGWPSFDQYTHRPSLAYGHSMRTFSQALRHWDWIDEELDRGVRAACHRAVEQFVDWSDEHHGLFDQPLQPYDPARLELLHNIPVIGGIGMSLAAQAAGHPAAAALCRRSVNLLRFLLDARQHGQSEGVSYDGYVMDFAADLLEIADESQRRLLLDHPQTQRLLDQSVHLGAPGQVMRLAEVGDVEPREMPFHASAHAKLRRFADLPRSAWYLSRCPLSWLRSDTLWAMLRTPLGPAQAPRPGAADAHYAAVLRSGWEAEDVAVAVSSSRSTFAHMHHDAGTVVIGTQGRWIITDPGYQQYLQKQERHFTIGPAAHNAPLINGAAQTRLGACELVNLAEPGDAVSHAAVDITRCYEDTQHLRRAMRFVWLIGRPCGRAVVIADRVEAAGPLTLAWHWHGHADAAWWVEDGTALLHLPPTTLRIRCLQQAIREADIDRRPGSRGQLTLTTIHAAGPVVCCWWLMTLGDATTETTQPDPFTLIWEGRTLRTD